MARQVAQLVRLHIYIYDVCVCASLSLSIYLHPYPSLCVNAAVEPVTDQRGQSSSFYFEVKRMACLE